MCFILPIGVRQKDKAKKTRRMVGCGLIPQSLSSPFVMWCLQVLSGISHSKHVVLHLKVTIYQLEYWAVMEGKIREQDFPEMPLVHWSHRGPQRLCWFPAPRREDVKALQLCLDRATHFPPHYNCVGRVRGSDCAGWRQSRALSKGREEVWNGVSQGISNHMGSQEGTPPSASWNGAGHSWSLSKFAFNHTQHQANVSFCCSCSLKQIMSMENSKTSQSLSDCLKAAECYRGTWVESPLEWPRSGSEKHAHSLDIFQCQNVDWVSSASSCLPSATLLNLQSSRGLSRSGLWDSPPEMKGCN